MTIAKLFVYGSYIWTFNAAGWLVISYASGITLGYAVAMGCAAMSGLCIIVAGAVKGLTAED